jgi:hypothetical protein
MNEHTIDRRAGVGQNSLNIIICFLSYTDSMQMCLFVSRDRVLFLLGIKLDVAYFL